MRLLRAPLVQKLIAIVLGGVFVYASIDKILEPGAFARIVYHYQVIGPSQRLGPLWPNLLAVVLPWIEAVIGLALISGVWRREGALIAAGLLVVFVGAVAAALFRGIDLKNCGCFSVSGEGRSAGLLLIVGDLAMLCAALVLAFVSPSDQEAATSAASQATAS